MFRTGPFAATMIASAMIAAHTIALDLVWPESLSQSLFRAFNPRIYPR